MAPAQIKKSLTVIASSTLFNLLLCKFCVTLNVNPVICEVVITCEDSCDFLRDVIQSFLLDKC